ncbi:hypothetical protein [Deferrisoma sp.]
MRIRVSWLGVIVGLWGIALGFLGRGAGPGCPLGTCVACGACFPRPGIERAADPGDRVA